MKCLQLVAFAFITCASLKCRTVVQPSELQPELPETLSIRLETIASQQSVDAVVGLCNSVHPTKTVQVQNLADGRFELRIFFEDISVSGRQLVLQQVRGISYVRIIEITY